MNDKSWNLIKMFQMKKTKIEPTVMPLPISDLKVEAFELFKKIEERIAHDQTRLEELAKSRENELRRHEAAIRLAMDSHSIKMDDLSLQEALISDSLKGGKYLKNIVAQAC
ncbi:hypothetical protein [Aeromonas phage SW69-9]|nr:hypothetical protein [Aeromonas phage L9-6]APU02529.1 hypothetical protein [Aeromonas phage SW69-9]